LKVYQRALVDDLKWVRDLHNLIEKRGGKY